MPEVFVGVGSNVDREYHLRAGLDALKGHFGELRCSSVWDNPAVGFVGDDFLNLVVAFQTDLGAQAVMDVLHRIEDRFGRLRGGASKMVSRTLDLDLLLYGQACIADGKLRVPRADITEQAFVLYPLAELAPDALHPVLGRTYAELWREFPGDRDSLSMVVLDFTTS